MNVVLHAGTLFSILIVYRNELLKLRLQPRVCLLIVLASVPAGLLGVFAKDLFAEVFATPLIAGIALFVTAALLVGGQKLERNELDYNQLSFGKALAIGCFQAAALVPGISRSGKYNFERTGAGTEARSCCCVFIFDGRSSHRWRGAA